MTTLLRNFRLWQKIVLIIVSFVVPVGVLAIFTFQSFEENVDITRLERDGTAFLRPVADLLRQVTAHRTLVQRYDAGEKGLEPEILSTEDQIDRAFAEVDQARQQYGKQLEYTPEGVQVHNHPRAWIDPMRAEWQTLKTQWQQLKPEDSLARHQQLIDDVQTLISHVGDTSTLSLDPALDSYYLMDVGVFALPPLQERLNGIVTTGLQVLDPRGGDSNKVLGLAALIRDNDLPRAESDLEISIRENPKSFGKSDSLEREMTPLMAECNRQATALVALATNVANSMGVVTRDQLIAAGSSAQEASIKLWQASFDQLDILLEKRAAFYETRLIEAMAFAGAALVLASLFAWVVIRNITVPLGRLTAAAQAAAHEGDLSHEIQLAGNDEIAKLTQAFGAMTDRFRNVASVAEQLANGDLHVPVHSLSAQGHDGPGAREDGRESLLRGEARRRDRQRRPPRRGAACFRKRPDGQHAGEDDPRTSRFSPGMCKKRLS